MGKQAKHIAVIMDGNGRWAQSLGLPRSAGHKAGSEIIQEISKAAIELGVECLTLFGLSRDNLQRSKGEVSYLLKLIINSIEEYIPDMVENGICIRFIGDIEGLGESVFQSCQKAELITSHNHKLILMIALNFSGRWQIEKTAKELCNGGIPLNDETIRSAFQSLLPSNPDILIRTGGDHRISDFVLYHLAYTEIFFLDVKWPDFTRQHLQKVLFSYGDTDRRYGKIQETL
jgi:undecaprenyl diphosphate synthase